MTRVLLVDDMAALREQVAYDLKRLAGYEVLTAEGGAEALKLLEREVVDAVLLDLEMPGTDGFAVLEQLRERGDETPVVVYTGTGNYERCVRAVQLGAYTFLDKSEPMEKVGQTLANAVRHGRLAAEVQRLRQETAGDSIIVGASPAVQTLRGAIETLAPIPSPVLVLGESGSGKELVARELHRLSPRARDPFVALNCAALPDNLLESELFGHEAGAFTGAAKLRRGAFETASPGTLFLDEVGELPPAAQATLLRVLEDGLVTRVGGNKPIAVETRVVAATHRDLEAESERGAFRRDLLYRLNVHVVTVPPLRDRPEDVPLLVEHLVERLAAKLGVAAKSFTPQAMGLLAAYPWSRNNVRELRNILERVLISVPGDTVGAQQLPAEIRGGAGGAGDAPGASGTPGGSGAPGTLGGSGTSAGAGDLKAQKAAAERAIVLRALVAHGWHITQTAAALGLADHSSLLRIMRRHDLKKPD